MPYYIKKKAKKKDKPLPLFDKAGVTVKKKPDLKAKLDKEFSLFIRLRDAMPNGYFRCISCGQIKPFTTFFSTGSQQCTVQYEHEILHESLFKPEYSHCHYSK